MSNVLSTYLKLVVNGVEIVDRKRACITSIDFAELCDGSDTCTINLTDPDFLFIEDNIFIEEYVKERISREVRIPNLEE